jgi:hypothetical protein
LDCRRYGSNGTTLEVSAGKPYEAKKPYKKSGGNKGMAFMQSMFEAYAKKQKKAGRSKKHKNVTTTLATALTVNRELGTTTWDLV